MKFASLGSGSSGNAALIQSQQTLLMLDCGFSCRETALRLKKLNIEPDQIDAIVVTHEHNDHISGVGTFSRKYNVPVWMNQGTYRARDLGRLHQLNIFHSLHEFKIGDVLLKPLIVPHDAREAVQFIFASQQRRLAVVTDLGHVSPYLRSQLVDLDALVIESNYDSELLRNGSYSPALKKRVSGHYGHLSNQQAAELISQLDLSAMQHLVAAHLSRENNSITHTLNTFQSIIGHMPEYFSISDDSGYGWKKIRSRA